MSYYGYQKRDIDKSMIDWAGLTKTISDDILKVRQDREDKRFELDEINRKQLKALDNITQGMDKNANTVAMEAAQNMRAALLQKHKLMKAGIMSVNDNKIFKTNVESSSKELNDVMKAHQDSYKKFMESGKTGDLAYAEFLANSMDFRGKRLTVSDNGEAFIAKINPKTGKVDENSLQSVRALRNVQLSDWKSIDVQTEVLKKVKGADTWKKAYATGTIEDSKIREEYQEWRTNTISSMIGNEGSDNIIDKQKTFSVLTDYLDYDYEYDEEKYNKMSDEEKSKVILMKPTGRDGDPEPHFSEGQEKAAREAVGNNIDMALGRKETYTAPKTYKPSDSEKSRQKEASSLYDISTRMIQGDSTAFGQVEGQKYITTDAEGKVKNIILGEPKLLDDTIFFYDQNQNVVTSIELTGDKMRDALNVAQVIRSGEKSDQVQSLFDQGAQQAGGKLPKLRGDKLEAGETASIIDEMPQDDNAAMKYLQAYPEITRVFDLDTDFDFTNKIFLTDKATGERKGYNIKTEKEKLKAFLENYGLKLRTAKQQRPAEEEKEEDVEDADKVVEGGEDLQNTNSMYN